MVWLLFSPSLFDLIFWKMTQDSGAVRSWELVETTQTFKPGQRKFPKEHNLSAKPGLCFSWQSRCLHGLSRGLQEVRVQSRSWVRAEKTKAWTSCITHWMILHRKREWTYGTLEFGLCSMCLGLHHKKSKTRRKIEKGREILRFNIRNVRGRLRNAQTGKKSHATTNTHVHPFFHPDVIYLQSPWHIEQLSTPILFFIHAHDTKSP